MLKTTLVRVHHALPEHLRIFFPSSGPVDRFERMRAAAGALFGLVITGYCTFFILGADSPSALWLLAPMGASSVLLFAVPSSPLAQPWSIIGGNLVASLVGVTCVKIFGGTIVSAGIAAGGAIALMIMLRCIHPPSGAVALTTVLGGAAVHDMGYFFVLSPIMLNSFLLLATALFYNNSTGRRYPHTGLAATPRDTKDMPPSERLGVTHADIDAILASYNQVLAVTREDLEEILQRAEILAYNRRFGGTTCADIMSKDLITAEFGTSLADAWLLLHDNNVTALPVINRGKRLIGIVTKADFFNHADIHPQKGFSQRLADMVKPSSDAHSDKHEVVGQIMTNKVHVATAEQPITELVNLMSDQRLHQIPVVNDDNVLIGIITQTDMIAALYETALTKG